jgi:hypothetical protein
MRTRALLVPLVLLSLTAFACPARAQAGGGFDLSWRAGAGGGALASAGGSFALGGTAGQPACGNSAGGAFSLEGGFWNEGTTSLVGVPDGPDAGARLFALRPARPNPFDEGTTIEFELAGPRRVRLEIFDVAGQRVRTLVDAALSPGRQRVAWDGHDATGARVANGIYFAHLAAGEYHAASRLVVLH